MYLTGASSKHVTAVAHEEGIGLMLQPQSHQEKHIPGHPAWAADTGLFSARGERVFDLEAYLLWLAVLPHPERCLFATAPDKVRDWTETWRRSERVLPMIRRLGLPAAVVAQNGLTLGAVPWGAFDVLFIGGDNAFKLRDAQPIVSEARRRGVWVHQGRCNSRRRFVASQVMGCDSADGTTLRYGPDVNLPRVLRWQRETRRQPSLALWETALEARVG